MSVSKTTTVKGITQAFIHRIERVDAVLKGSGRYAIVTGKIYASDAAKAANDAIGDFSVDVTGAPAENVLAASVNVAEAAYTELKKDGCLLAGGMDC